MDINAIAYGTKGLPFFGAHAIDNSKTVKIAELDQAFNTFMATVKGLTAPGNELALTSFGAGLQGIYWQGYTCVAGKPVVNV